jgi:hypothetical protein
MRLFVRVSHTRPGGPRPGHGTSTYKRVVRVSDSVHVGLINTYLESACCLVATQTENETDEVARPCKICGDRKGLHSGQYVIYITCRGTRLFASFFCVYATGIVIPRQQPAYHLKPFSTCFSEYQTSHRCQQALRCYYTLG